MIKSILNFFFGAKHKVATKQVLPPYDFKQHVVDKLKEEEEKIKKVIKEHYPEHVGHDQIEESWHYFDAMFKSVDLTCSCGKTLSLTRKMFDNVNATL